MIVSCVRDAVKRRSLLLALVFVVPCATHHPESLAAGTAFPDISTIVVSPQNVTYFPQLRHDDATWLGMPVAVINLELSDNGAIANAVRRDPGAFEMCVDWNAFAEQPLSALHANACHGLQESNNKGFMMDSSAVRGTKGAVVRSVFRTWLRHRACTDLGETSECPIPGLPSRWIQSTVQHVHYSLVLPGAPAELSVVFPGHQSVLEKGPITPTIELELTDSGLSESVRATPSAFYVCYAVESPYSMPLHDTDFSVQSLPCVVDSQPRCSSIDTNRFAAEPVLCQCDARYRIQAWLERRSKRSGFAEVGHQVSYLFTQVEFHVRTSALSCSLASFFGNWKDSVKNIVGARSPSLVHIYETSARAPCWPSRKSHKLDSACPEWDAIPTKQRHLLIVAAPRSGTHFSVEMLRSLGVEVNHEGNIYS